MANDLRKVSSSKSVAIIECKIIASNGEVKDLREPLLFNNIQIYESIYSPVITGTIQLIEGVNLYSLLSMHGNEYLYISFCRPGEDAANQKYTRTFRIYKSSLRQPAEKTQVQTYVLHFCSEEMVFSNQQIISRSLVGLTSSDYILRILASDLRVNLKRIAKFERSQGIQNVTLSKFKPFELIDYLCKNAYNENNSPYLFFENREGYNFVSMEKLFQQDALEPALNYSTARYTYTQEDSPFKNANEVKKYKFEQSFDVLDGTEKGMYANRLYTLDIIRQKYTKHDYSLANEQSAKVMLDGFFPVNNARNRNNKALYEEYDAQVNYWLTNLNQNETPYFINKSFRVTNTEIEKTLMQRKVQINLLNNTRIWCSVPGNPNYTVGYVAKFNLPSFLPNNSERAIDPYHSGKYLITDVRHSITPDELETILVMSKNSVAIPFDVANNFKPSYKNARDF
jgi:hypothetical protein